MESMDQVREEMLEFRNGFGTCIIASVDRNGYAISSYAPIINNDGRFYLYISQVAEHFDSIRTNPDKIEIMFIQDESKAHSFLLRKRLRYKARAFILQRDSDEFTKTLRILEENMHGKGGIKNVKRMLDFHLIRLEFLGGRYVKGFGAAYDVSEAGEVNFAREVSPHLIDYKA